MKELAEQIASELVSEANHFGFDSPEADASLELASELLSVVNTPSIN